MSIKKPILLTIIICLLIVFVLAPIIPKSIETSEQKVLEFKYEQKYTPDSPIPSTIRDINITNKEDVGGTFSVLIVWTPEIIDGAPPVIGHTHTESKFIQPGQTYTYKVPADWKTVLPRYNVRIQIYAPTKIENITTTETDFKSIIELFSE
jgi:hypothetical protein